VNESDYNQLKEKGWRRELTPAEAAELQAWLAGHPGSLADWEDETRLNEAINRLPDAPVPSNFTSRVLQALERESAAEKRAHVPARKWSLRYLLPGTAAVALILGLGLLAHQHSVAQRTELAQDLRIVSGVHSLPSPEILQDFDTIQKMGATAGPDRELLALNQDLIALKK
jgi:hypothetical protein